MKVFKSIADVEAAGLSPPVHGVVYRVVSGFINALAEYGQDYQPEEDGCFVGCVLHNNQFGYSLIFVDSPKLDPALRAKLVDECDAGAAR